MKTKLIVVALTTLLTTLMLGVSAYADIIGIFRTGSDASIPAPYLVIKTPTDVVGHEILGQVADRPDVAVLFMSHADELKTTTGGSAGLTSVTGLIHDVSVHPIDFGFGHVELNPLNPLTANSITITATTCIFTFGDHCINPMDSTLDMFGRTTGNNRVGIFPPMGELITEVRISSPGGFATLEQVRVTGAEIVHLEPIPEPSSMLLLGSGLLVFTQVPRRKLRRNKERQEAFRHQ